MKSSESIAPVVHFAPLQGLTDAEFRNLHARFFGGVACYYTPFVRLEKGGSFRNRDLRDVDPSANRVGRIVPQLIAATEPEASAIVSRFQELGYRDVDLNLGCPFPLQARRRKGAGILPFPDETARLLEVTLRFPEIRFSIKMRLGWDSPDQALRLLPVLERFPLVQVALHARLGVQQYRGSVDEAGFQAFYEACPFPLFYNGDLTTPEQVASVYARFPRLSGVLIGRGLLADPALALKCRPEGAPSSDEITERFRAFHEALWEAYAVRLRDERLLLQKMQALWEYAWPSLEKRYRKAILKSRNSGRYRLGVEEALASFSR